MKTRMIWLGCFSYLLIGFATVVFGSLLSELLDIYGRSYGDGGQLIFAQFAGFLAGVLLVPFGLRLLGYRGILTVSFALLLLAHALLYLKPQWSILFIPLVINGFGFGTAQTAVGTLLLESMSDRKAVIMSRLEVSFGIGALVMPILSGLFISNQFLFGSFAIIAALALIMALIWGMQSFRLAGYKDPAAAAPSEMADVVDSSPEEAFVDESPQVAATVRTVKRSLLLFLLGFVFIYVGLETSVINFLPSLFAERLGLTNANAALSVSFFWVSMIAGRLLSGYIAERAGYAPFLLISTIGALLALCGLALFPDKITAYVFVLVLGLFLSGIFAIAIVYANRLFANTTRQTTSILIASGGIGGAVLPLLVGWSMDYFQPAHTLWMLAGGALCMLLFLVRLRIH
ncbi:MFS transporter [Paenibacillus nasutitermitis]|uniref:Glucose/mannose transporter GlcP n=1 Tax=Paenibacillus nasutitermitis TaxID=1652958 RepID=A0A917DYL5_9BACL|nr:MFS transporter [Paenibacillus nasutitermitis]GGD81181.1 glucose/mannose transporter GlcP [Paenibacillus nasutitermitis]